MSRRVFVARPSDIPPGTGKVVTVEGRVLGLFNVRGTFWAIDNTCPHRGGPLGEGVLENTVVTCPWHGWEFDVCSGQSPRRPDLKIRTVPLEVRGEEVLALLD